MTSTLKDHKILIFFSILFFIGCWSIDSVLWGLDGFSLWMPIVAEYLRGTYENSAVIFGGQDLLDLYGNLPFWPVLRWLKASPTQLMNVTFFILVMSFYLITLEIYKGLSKKSDNLSSLIIFIYCFASPIFLNRVYAGHFNLLFGMLPFLLAVSLIYNRSKIFSLFAVFVLCCSFSTPSYQILAYHFFYIPLLYVWIKSELGELPSWYIRKVTGLTFIAILISYPNISAMIGNASSNDNIRSSAVDVVYSYLISILSDISSLLMSSFNKFTTRNNFYLFHEINYPIGLTFLSVFFLRAQYRKINICILLTMVFLFAFSSNTPFLNLFAELPLIKLFRVPQRSIMIAAYLAPLFFLLVFKDRLNLKSFFFFLAFVFVGNGLPFFELICGLWVAVILFFKKIDKYPELYFSFVFSTLFMGLPDKYVVIRDGNTEFVKNVQVMSEINQKFKLADQKIPIHFLDENAFHLITAANFIGIPTSEGYGHPPKRNFLSVAKHFKVKINPMTNIFSLTEYGRYPEFVPILKELGIKRIVFKTPSGSYDQTIIED